MFEYKKGGGAGMGMGMHLAQNSREIYGLLYVRYLVTELWAKI